MFPSRQSTTRASAPALIVALAGMFAALASTNAQEARVEQTNKEEVVAYSVEKDVRIPTRHNVELSADLYLPRAEGPYPVIMTITPYDQDAPPNGISGQELKGAGNFDRGEPVNRGTHTLHFGADRASYLLVPFIGAD